MMWETKKLNEVANVFSGCAFKSSDMDKQAGIPLIKIKNIHDKKVDKDCETFLNPSAFKKNYQKFFLQKDDFLVAMTGQGSVGRIGKMRSFKEGFLVNQRVGIVRVNKVIADPEFIYQSLATDDTEGMYFNLAMGAGQPNLSPKDIGSANIPFPPLHIQQKIAGILAAYDDLIENNLKRIKLLEEMAQITYEEWFVRLRFPGHESTPINPETSLPEGWTKEDLSEFIDLERGIEPGSANYSLDQLSGYIPFIRVGDLSKRESNIFVAEELAKGKICTESDVLLSLDGSPGMVSIGLSGAYSTGIRKAVIKDNRFSTAHVYAYLKSSYIQNLIAAHATGATILHAGSAVKKMKMACPTDELLTKFDGIANTSFSSILNLKSQNQRLREARDILLPRLMTGVIDVESYDPAGLLKEAA